MHRRPTGSARKPAPVPPPPDSKALLRWAAAIGRAEAEYLLCRLLKVPRHELYAGLPVSAARRRRFEEMVRRARENEPVQYITGSAPFLDLDLYVDRRVLVPRPETEELVARALARVSRRQGIVEPPIDADERDSGVRGFRGSGDLTPWTLDPLDPSRALGAVRRASAASSVSTVVDFGTGSGCIAIAVARALPLARVLAVDSSPAALEVARRNVRRYRLSGRVKLLRVGGLHAPQLRRLNGKVDLLIANPPYVPSGRVAKLSPTVFKFEPMLALDGGPKGVNIVAMLLAQGPTLLRKGGLLAMEIDWSNATFVRRHSPLAEVERDLSGRNRYVFLER